MLRFKLSYIQEADENQFRNQFQNIDAQTYKTILRNDPTSKLDNGFVSRVGPLGKYAMMLYKKRPFELNKLADIYADLETFKRKSSLINKSIQDIRDVSELNRLVSRVKNKETSNQKKKNIKDGEKDIVLYESIDEWQIIIPLTKEASIKWGMKCNSKWCTASNSKSNMFEIYMSKGDLYIFHNTTDPSLSLQFHMDVNEMSFMNNQDKPVTVSEIKQKYPNLSSVLDNIIKDEKEKQINVKSACKIDLERTRQFNDTIYLNKWLFHRDVSPLIDLAADLLKKDSFQNRRKNRSIGVIEYMGKYIKAFEYKLDSKLVINNVHKIFELLGKVNLLPFGKAFSSQYEIAFSEGNLRLLDVTFLSEIKSLNDEQLNETLNAIDEIKIKDDVSVRKAFEYIEPNNKWLITMSKIMKKIKGNISLQLFYDSTSELLETLSSKQVESIFHHDFIYIKSLTDRKSIRFLTIVESQSSVEQLSICVKQLSKTQIDSLIHPVYVKRYLKQPNTLNIYAHIFANFIDQVSDNVKFISAIHSYSNESELIKSTFSKNKDLLSKLDIKSK